MMKTVGRICSDRIHTKFKIYYLNFIKTSLLVLASLIVNCTSDSLQKTKILFDTDANNELDDQHALAYLLFNGQDFEVEGITVNKTRSGGDIDEHYK